MKIPISDTITEQVIVEVSTVPTLAKSEMAENTPLSASRQGSESADSEADRIEKVIIKKRNYKWPFFKIAYHDISVFYFKFQKNVKKGFEIQSDNIADNPLSLLLIFMHYHVQVITLRKHL